MIELISYRENKKWNRIISSFPLADTYFSCEYATSYMESVKGVPYLLNYENNGVRIAYPIIEKDVSDFSAFKGAIDKGIYFDWNTPYGYGGPLTNLENIDIRDQLIFRKELYAFAKERNIVSQFVRFHPIIKNHLICPYVIDSMYVKDTIYIDLTTENDLMCQMESKNRNLLRKAIKNNVLITHDKGEKIQEFMYIYNKTMDRDNASSFYYFPKSYYEYLKNNMSNETEYFYAYKDGNMIAASIFFYKNKSMHYHLSANLVEFRTFAPTNLILYVASNWGRDMGMSTLHLGGGVGIEDSLFHFKKQFNKNGRVGFYIGRSIFMPDKYNYLLEERKNLEEGFEKDNQYFIQYRKPQV